jgi:hypothetical protein
MDKPLPPTDAPGTRALQPRTTLLSVKTLAQVLTPAQFKAREVDVLLNDRMQETIISRVLANMRLGKLQGKIDLSGYFCKGVVKSKLNSKLKQDYKDLCRAIEYLIEKVGWQANVELCFGKGVVVRYSLATDTR